MADRQMMILGFILFVISGYAWMTDVTASLTVLPAPPPWGLPAAMFFGVLVFLVGLFG